MHKTHHFLFHGGFFSDFNGPCSLSLAVLRDCTIKHGELGSQDRSALTSAISAMPSQTVQRMVQEVRTLEDDTLKVQQTQIYI